MPTNNNTMQQLYNGIILPLSPQQLQELIAPIVQDAVRNALQQERKLAAAETVLLTHKEAAESLQVSVSTLHAWVKEGRVKQTRIGKSGIRYRRTDLDQAIEAGLTHKFLHHHKI